MSEEHYHSKWISITNVMKNSNLKVSRIAPHGSRARRTHRPDSDMDVIFAVSGNPNRREFYPKLINVLKSNFPLEKIYPGSHYNVVHLNFRAGGKFELVLLSESKFDKEYKDVLNYRRSHL